MTLHNRFPLVRTSLACILLSAISLVAAPHTPTHASSAAHSAATGTLTRLSLPALRGPIVDGAGDNSNSCADTYIAIGGAGTTYGLARVSLSIWSHNGAIKKTQATVTLRNYSSGYSSGFSAIGAGNGLNGTQYTNTTDAYTGGGSVTATLTGNITLNDGTFCVIPTVSASDWI